ncbi:MAG: class I SAM-dependent methyltransferase [Acidobacteriota bacterium]|nr:class I SAM-dependent methyltransferase [Acidobacteriota bacterium]
MRPLERIHEGYFASRRVRLICDHLLLLIPPSPLMLDVGGGDGKIARELVRRRPDIELRGIDVIVRPGAAYPVDLYDGRAIPFTDRSFDVVLLVDVLHHTEDPLVLLREAARVAREAILIKDHLSDRFLALPTLRFMDRVGNARFGIALPHNYWSRRSWLDAFQLLGLRVAAWKNDLKLYPPVLDWFFGRSLHFVAQLYPAGPILAKEHPI